MKLQDYLHYYIGATYWTDNSEGEVNAVTLQHIYPMIEKGKNVQLHLRRLEDMTEEEAIELTSLVVHSTEFVNVSTYRHNFTNDLMVEWGALDESNEVDDFFNATGERSWSAAQFHYLLQRGFDLFGLIDAGLAIDLKPLNP